MKNLNQLSKEEIESYNDSLFKCTICGQIGTVGRCCGDETRIPLNQLAIDELKRLKIIIDKSR